MILAAIFLAALQQTVSSGPAPEIGPPEPARTVSAPARTTLPTGAPSRDPLTADRTFSIPGGPRVVQLTTPGSELVAVRVSVPVSEAASEAGAAKVLQLLTTQRGQARAAGLGLSFEGVRTPWGVAYTVAGARAELESILALVREAVAEPELPEIEFERQRRELREEVLRTVETPSARVLAELRSRAVPGAPPLEGTPESIGRLTRNGVREVWARTHRAQSMSVVVAGDVPEEVLSSSLRDLGATGTAPARPSGGTATAQPRGTQVYRHWLGEAFRITDARDPHAAVAALLLAEWLAGAGEPYEAEIQLMDVGDVQLLTVVAAAYSGNSVAMRQRVPRLLPNTRQALTAERVAAAVARVRQETLQRARTPAGLVAVVGRHLDATREPATTRRYVTALDRVTLESTRAFLTTLERQTPVRAEARP